MIVFRLKFRDRLLKKSLKIEAYPFKAEVYLAFKHCFSFATYLAANFGCYQFNIMPDIVSKLLLAVI